MEIRPQEGRQEEFLSSPADIVIYGGAAGGGKTWSLLLEPLRHSHVKDFYCMIFRRTYPEITNLGGLWDESEKVYFYTGGQPTKGDLRWRWPKGARVEFRHLQHEDNLRDYDGAQICLLCFDQLEHFTEKMFFYMMVRNRSLCGVRPYIRATCNPDPDSFLAKFLSWWIAEDGYADLDRAGKIRWFVRWQEEIYWADTAQELIDKFDGYDVQPKSCTFIPATVYDNKILMAADPGYLANLQAQPQVERERFLGDPKRGGNWKIKPSAGKVFNRDWFEIVSNAPPGGVEGDGWDFAATEKSLKNTDPDYTCRIKMRKVNGTYYILDMLDERWAAGEIDALMLSTCRQDSAMATQAGVNRFVIRWENEPGSSGLRVTNSMVKLLAGFDVQGMPITGDKVTRAKGLASQAMVRNVKLVAGPWNDRFLSSYHGFPDLKHDDPIDAGSVIFNVLVDIPDKLPERTQVRSPLQEAFRR